MILHTRKPILGGGLKYSKPAMVKTGTAPGTSFAAKAYGYDITPGNDPGSQATFWYLNKNMKGTGKKFYWELDRFITASDYMLCGITADPTTAVNYLGYSSANAGIYTGPSAGSWAPWCEAWSGRSISTPAPTGVAAGDVIGFAYDDVARILYVFINNDLKTTISFGTGPSVVYAGFTWQGSQEGQVFKIRLGPGNTIYNPPTGYEWL